MNLKKWITAIAALIVIGCSTDTEIVEKEVSTTQPVITITTAGEVPLIFEMATATVDIQYIQRTMTERDLTNPEIIAEVKALGFQRLWNFGDIALMNYAYANATGTGSGYNGKRTDFPTPKGETFESYEGGVLNKIWPHDWLDYTLEFGRAVGVKNDVCLNKKETWAECDHKIRNSTGEYIKFSSETTTMGWTWQQYLTWATKIRDSITKYHGTTKKLIADEPNMLKGGKPAAEWRKNVNPTTLTGFYGGRVYWQWKDQMGASLNQDSNILLMKVFFDDSIPSQIASFQRLFPGWKIFATEIVIVDNREGNEDYQFINKSITGIYCWGRYYESFIKYQDIQPVAVQMSLKGLLDATAANTRIITLMNTLLKPDRKVVTIAFTNMEGVTGSALRFGNNSKSYALLINNSSLNTYSLSNFQIDAKKKSPTVTTIHHTATNWQSPITIDTTVSESYSIPPGVSVLNFTLGSGTAESRITK